MLYMYMSSFIVVINGGPSVNPPIPGEGEDNSKQHEGCKMKNLLMLTSDSHT